MLGNLGLPEVAVLVVIGLLIFGPTRLPKAASDAAKMIRQLREMAKNATTDLRAELGPEMADIDFRSLNPRTIVQSALFDDDETFEARHGTSTGTGSGSVASATKRAASRRVSTLAAGERAPYDPDAT